MATQLDPALYLEAQILALKELATYCQFLLSQDKAENDANVLVLSDWLAAFGNNPPTGKVGHESYRSLIHSALQLSRRPVPTWPRIVADASGQLFRDEVDELRRLFLGVHGSGELPEGLREIPGIEPMISGELGIFCENLASMCLSELGLRA